jgi:lysophospholipase L1-like esterase
MEDKAMKTILCYGDSNTHGSDPRTGGRHGHNTRWPMALDAILNAASSGGRDFWVVEEGLGGRTSCRDDPVEGDKNGFAQLIPILQSHAPLDLVIILLGTNDLKARFNPTPYDIAYGAKRVAVAAQNSGTGPDGTAPKVLLVCPPPIDNHIKFSAMFGEKAAAISRELPPFFAQAAKECGACFFDAGTVARPSVHDGLHWDPECHAALAKAAAEKVREIFAGNSAWGVSAKHRRYGNVTTDGTDAGGSAGSPANESVFS